MVKSRELSQNEIEAIARYNAGEQPCCSTSIDEDTFTYGYGELDDFGFWEFQIPHNFLIKGEVRTVTEQRKRGF